MKRSGSGESRAHRAYQISCGVVAVVATAALIFMIVICVQTLMGSDDYLHIFGGLINE